MKSAQFNRTPPFAFARVSCKPKGGSKESRCYLSGQPLHPGEMVYQFRFKDYNDVKDHFVGKEAAEASPEFMASVRWHGTNMFPPELFFEAEDMKENNSYDHYVLEKDQIEEYLGGSWRDVPAALQVIDRDKAAIRSLRDTFIVLGFLVCTSLHLELLDRYDSLSPELKVTLALSDNKIFRRKALEAGLLRDWETVHPILSTGRHSVKDLLVLAEWGARHPDILTLLEKADRRFFLFDFFITAPCGYHETRYGGKAANLLFLYTAVPELLPTIANFDPADPMAVLEQRVEGYEQRNYPYACTPYFYPYLYRAGVLARLLAGKEKDAEECMRLMGENCHYYYHGSPDGYVNQTQAMMKQYLKRYPAQ